MRYVHIKNNKIEELESNRDIETITKLKRWEGTVIQTDESIEGLISSGEIETPENMKYDSDSMGFVYYTDLEKYENGIITKDEYTEIILVQRKSRYFSESDPLKIEAEYNSIIKDTDPDYTDWIAAVSQIKTDLPKPE